MARAGAAVVLAFAICCLLVATAPARRPAELPARVLDAVDREAAAEPLRPEPVAVASAEDAEKGTALAVPEDGTVIAVRGEGPQQRSSLLCLFFRCGGEPAGSALVARGSSEEPAALDGWARPAVAGKAEVEDEEVGDVEDDGEEPPYDSDSDSDCDSDSDDDEDEGGVVGWFWRLALLIDPRRP